MRIFCANLVGHLEHFAQALRIDSRFGAGFAQRREDIFGRDVAHQIVSRKGAAT